MMSCLLLSKIRTILTAVAFIVVVAEMLWIISLLQQDKMPSDAKNVQETKIVKDLQSKWTILAPQGQLWGFAPDQNLQVKIIDVKPSTISDRIIIAVDLKATAKIPAQQESPKEQISSQMPNKTSTKTTDAPLFVDLAGVAKLHYEKIGASWYLLEVEGVTLGVNPH